MKMEKRIELTAKEKKLHEEACAFARQHSDSEFGLCRVLREVDESKLYFKFGYSRTFYYAVKELKLTESVASMTITVARKTALIPELRAAVDEKRLSVSKASRLTSGITAENASEVIAFAQTHTSNEIDEEMARRNPGKPRRDSNRPIGNDKVELRAQISTATNKKLKRAESLLASKGKATNLDSVLDASLELFLDHHDPVRKAERAQARAAKKADRNSARTERRTSKAERSSEQAERITTKSERNTGATQRSAGQAERSSGQVERSSKKTEQCATRAEQNAGQSNEFCLNRTTHSIPQDRNSSLAEVSINDVSLGNALLGDSIGDLSLSDVSLGESSIEKIGDKPSFKKSDKPYRHSGDKSSFKAGGKPYPKSGDKLQTKPGGKPSKPTLSQHEYTKSDARAREHIKAKTNHAVMLRTGGQCDFVNERGERCPEDRYLHIHHIVPLSQGGTDDPSNLTCLCSGHHALVHQLSFAIDGQITWLRSPQEPYLA